MFELAKHLQQQGQIAVIPTDTVYGVVARAVDSQAVKRLYTLKRRETKPGTLVAANIDQLADLGIERNDLLGTDAFWPGAVSIITACGQNLNYLHQGVGSLAVRIPDDPWLLELLQQTGPANTVDEARDYFGDQVSWYQDGGVVNREPSTVIRITNNNIEIIRLGVVKISDSDNKLYPRFDS
jgi:L-threonylcarbamoyladenylate synthase